MRSSRLGLTLVAALASAVLLAGAALLGVQVQTNALRDSLDADLAAHAAQIELSMAGGIITDEVADPRRDDRIIQIVDILNRVVAASPNLTGQPPIADWATGIRTLGHVPPLDGPYRVLTIETTRTTEPLTVHVGASYEYVEEAAAVLARFMALAVPVLTALFGLLVWVLVGRAAHSGHAIEDNAGQGD